MALILKAGLTFNPDISASFGVDMTGSDYYAVIDNVLFDKDLKTCQFTVKIYASQAGRNSGSKVLERVNFSYDEDLFDAEMTSNGLTIPEAYVIALTHERLTDFESDE